MGFHLLFRKVLNGQAGTPISTRSHVSIVLKCTEMYFIKIIRHTLCRGKYILIAIAHLLCYYV